MQQDASQAGGEDVRASTGGVSSLEFNIFSDLENNADMLEATEPADEGISTLEPTSAFAEKKRNLPESCSRGNSRNNEQRILMESPRRRRKEGIKMAPQDGNGEVVYLSRTRRGTMRSKLVIDKINEMKMKLGSKLMPRRVGKTKVYSEISVKAVNSAKRKRVEEAMDLGQGDYQLPDTNRMLTDVAMVSPILMAGIKSTGYKSKRSDRTLTGATLEMEILSQCGESSMKDLNHLP